ncbi:hypothetical protein, partial [Luteimonas sp. TWI1437]|uniref:hypothetical protein n=1 Tax=Luteimonas sp. TWI1437 TaxID=3136804 RepID=UPI0032097B5D
APASPPESRGSTFIFVVATFHAHPGFSTPVFLRCFASMTATSKTWTARSLGCQTGQDQLLGIAFQID